MVNRDIVFRVLYIPNDIAKRVPSPRNDFRIGVKIDFCDRISKIFAYSMIICIALVHLDDLAKPADLGVWITKNTNSESFLDNRDTVFRVLYIPKAIAKRVPNPRNDFRIGVKNDFSDRISKIFAYSDYLYYIGSFGWSVRSS